MSDATAKTVLFNEDPDPDKTKITPPPGDTGRESKSDDDRPNIPDVVLEKEIGRGGMGVVYSGRQTYLDRRVAVKLLLIDKADEDYVKRFQREAKILAGLSHQHIVSCYSAGVTSNGHPYLVMEFIDGPNLQEWVKVHGALSEDQALRVVHALAQALNHAHENGIIHRDVKPDNVLLAKKEHAEPNDPFPFETKLVDLGLARPPRSQSEMNLTVEGMVMGTPTTMAPEQFEDPDGIDFRADMYGLGCVLYYALTGSPAFTGRTIPQLVSAKMTGPIPNPSVINKKISGRVCELVKKLLAVKRDNRPASYKELITACACENQVKTSSNGMLVGIAAVAIIAVIVAIVAVSMQKEKPALVSEHNKAATTTPESGIPPASELPSAPVAPIKKELGAAQTLFPEAIEDRFKGWDFTPESRWDKSGVNDLGVAGFDGIISRAVPADNWELSVQFNMSNGEKEAKHTRVGVIFPDNTQLFVQINNLTAFYTKHIDSTYDEVKNQSSFNKATELQAGPVHLQFVLEGKKLSITVNEKPMEEVLELPAVPVKVFIEVIGKARVEVTEMTIRLPDGVNLK